MKKQFSLIDPKKKIDRVADQIRFEVKKYIKRERNKNRPEGVDFWDFDCRFGVSKEEAQAIHVSKINEAIAQMVASDIKSFYLEILSRPGTKTN